ncbi:alpha/beta fold hydrolase [Microbacterium sp. ISL-103]|uniref:alpha/beta fold hydrolase n=1 Tax=Microbacterium sp. ISL-103 TaxID=2819156 RepID=UPI001BE57BA0|nr:alpha/beta fold hydrolase [Microbacterium sp. ISL-103]MBT2474928.1 alpha/beta fold hydrolase [Microbacterium sp. ISL-103]
MTTKTPLHDETFICSDSLRLTYRVADGVGVPLILHHGFATTADAEWVNRGIVDALAVLGRPIIILDPRGHGRSESPHIPEAYGERRLAMDLIELGHHLGGRVDVLGYSMGAVATLLAASLSSTLIRQAAVGGVGSGIVEVGGLDTRVLETDLLAAVFRSDGDDSEAPELAAWRDGAAQMGLDVLALAALAESLQVDGIDTAAIVQQPLVIAGADDFLADRPEVLARSITNSRLLVVPGDHNSTLDHPLVHQALVTHFG